MAAPPGEIDDDEEGDEWRFSVEDVGEDDEPDQSDTEGNIAGTLDRNQPLEPGEIDPENAVFVVLGVLLVVVLIVAAIVGF